MDDGTFPALLKILSDSSDEVCSLNLVCLSYNNAVEIGSQT